METTTQTSQPQTNNGHSQPQSTTPRRSVRPRASVTETTDGFTVQVEMPGVPQNGLEVTFENGDLTLVGHRAHAAGAGDGHEVLYRESNAADYRRTFEVDSTIDATLSLPKAEAAKPRRIEIGGLN